MIENVVVKPAAYKAHVMSALLPINVVAIGTIVINCVHDPNGRSASIDNVLIVPAEVNPPPFELVVQRLFPYPLVLAPDQEEFPLLSGRFRDFFGSCLRRLEFPFSPPFPSSSGESPSFQ